MSASSQTHTDKLYNLYLAVRYVTRRPHVPYDLFDDLIVDVSHFYITALYV